MAGFFCAPRVYKKIKKKIKRGLIFLLKGSMLLSVTETVEKTRKGGKNEDVNNKQQQQFEEICSSNDACKDKPDCRIERNYFA